MKRLFSAAARLPVVVSVIALAVSVLSLGGGAYAAGWINGSQIRPGSLPANRLQAHSVGAGQLAPATFGWHRLTLLSGWTPLSATDYGYPSYAVSNGVLYLSGILSAAKSDDPEVAVLPKGARPAHFLWLTYMNFGGDNVGEMEIQPNGDVFVYGSTTGTAAVDPSLAAISFPLSS
jgi:hypothetical protein